MKRLALYRLGPAVLATWAGVASAAPLTFNTALPISQDEWILREQFVYMKSADDPTPMSRHMEVSGLMTMLGYGVTRNFALFGVLPYADKRLSMNMGSQDIHRSQAGFGDAMFMGRYTAYEDNASGHTFRIAPFLGVKAPTGSDHASDHLGRLPPSRGAPTSPPCRAPVSVQCTFVVRSARRNPGQRVAARGARK